MDAKKPKRSRNAVGGQADLGEASQPRDRNAPISATLKPVGEKRKIRYASKKKAIAAGEWAVKAYSSVFRRLAE